MSLGSTDVFLRNMAALWRTDARLALALDESVDNGLLPLEPTRSGSVTTAVTLPGGGRIYLHSRYDPAAEAEQFCRAALDSRPADPEGPGAALVAVLCGMGLGHHIGPLLRRVGPDGVVIVCEPDLDLLRTALHCTDVSGPLAARRLIVLYDDDKADLHAKLDPLAALLMLGTRFVAPPASRQVSAEFHQRMRAAVADFAAFSKMAMVTLLSNSRVTCENIANNLPAYVATPSIAALKDRFRGTPAVIAAAGPSLGRNVDRLHAVRSHVLLIAVQTTLKPLLARGLRPDFVTSLDFSNLSKRFFEGADVDGVHLIAEPKAAWEVIDTFLGGPPGTPDRPPRRLSLLYNDFAERCLGDALGRREGLRAGSTVAHLALYLAEHLGCDPIILIGQDLGYSGGVYYTPGVAIHDAWAVELGPFCTLEMKEWERIARARNILIRAQDVHGRPIYTDEQMFTYLQQFERDFAACPARIIDATEGGVAKAGAEAMTLEAALQAFATLPRTDLFDGGLDAGAAFDFGRLPEACASLRRRRADLAEFRGLCEETRCVLAEMTGLLDQPREFDRRIVHIDELRALVHERRNIFRMVSDVSQLGELQKFSADRRLALDRQASDGTETMPAAERARRQLERDQRFIDALLEGCGVLDGILSQALLRTEDFIREAELAQAAIGMSAAGKRDG